MPVENREMLLADVRRSILATLDFTFGEPRLEELTGVLEQYDSVICNSIVDSVTSYHDVLWPYSELYEDEDQRTVSFGNTIFEVTTGTDVWHPETLNLAFIPRASKRPVSPPRSVSFDVSECGRYSQVIVFRPVVDFAFEFHMSLLEEIVRTILETGHAWVSQRLLRLVAEASMALSRELYQLLWRLKPGIDRRRVWFLLMCNGRAFYLVEEIIGLASIELFSTFTVGSRTPMELYVEFVTANLPVDVVLSRQAEHLGVPLQADLAQSKYRSSNTSLVEAEMAIFGESLTVMPLYLGDAYRLVAIYPAELGDSVSPTLTAHQEDFESIVIGGSSAIAEMDTAINRGGRMSVYAKLGEFFGGFVTGVSQ